MYLIIGLEVSPALSTECVDTLVQLKAVLVPFENGGVGFSQILNVGIRECHEKPFVRNLKELDVYGRCRGDNI